ncbi:MAG: hypothetical protein E6K91_00110 [Thaumarchaeota archaeon]|nr:MAG: hypothetical protein E6K91_00110 [Nitrososphaerota archaeon]
MFNNILRKITSLTLLTILLTSTAAFAMPNALPAAHAATNANLFVSAENSLYNNYFAGPQVIQVVVSDPDINRLDQSYGEPTVTINGKKLRMAQNTDGNWYAYFADRDQAIAADKTVGLAGKGLDFGQFCASTSAVAPSFTETKGFTVARAVTGSVDKPANSAAFGACTDLAGAAGAALEHVVRQNKTLTHPNGPVTVGQIALGNAQAWPIIQLYDFGGSNPGTIQSVTVDYQKGGGDQIVNLTFGRIPSNLVTSSLDRPAGYPVNSQVFITLSDPQLNIDPTEEDSWTWGANATNSTLYYEAFTRNGAADADGTAGMQNLIGNLTTFMFNHNGKFTLNPKAQSVNVVDFQDNGKQVLVSADGTNRGQTNVVNTASIGINSAPVTFIETGGVNIGAFGTWDGAKVSDIVTSNTQTIRGQSATIEYNDVKTSIVGAFGFASIGVSATNGTWASGQKIIVTLTDTDANRNTKITEHLDLLNPAIYNSGTGGVQAMTIGTPLSLSNGADKAIFVNTTTLTITSHGNRTVGLLGAGTNTTTSVAPADFINVQHIDLVTPVAATTITGPDGGIIIDPGKKMSDLLNTIHNTLSNSSGTRFKGFNFINYDLRSLATGATGTFGTVNVYLVYNTAGTGILNSTGGTTGTLTAISLANSTSLQDFINLNQTSSNVANGALVTNNLFKVPKTASIGLLFTFSGTPTLDTSQKPIAADFFSVGITGDGTSNDQRINNAIYRWELEETGDNTSTFTGSTEYVMLNQLNIFDPTTYSQLRTISHQVKFVAIQDMLQAESRAPQITYEDLGTDGQFTPVSAQQDIPTHTGVVSFDNKTYKIADTVTITLKDADLNVDNDLIDIYTVVNPLTAGGVEILPGGGAGNIPAAAQDPATETIGKRALGTYADGRSFGRLLDIQFGQTDIRWANTGCFAGAGVTAGAFNLGLADTGFSLVETGSSTGIFTGTFEIPDQFCFSPTKVSSTVGQNIKVNYVDFRDDSSKLVEVSDNAGIRGNTGSIKLDKAVYPVPFGTVGATLLTGDFEKDANLDSLNGVFPLHRDQVGKTDGTGGIVSGNVLASGDIVVHVRVNDRDYDTSAAGTDHIATGAFDANHGPVAIQISRQGQSMLLASAGSLATQTGVIVNLPSTSLPKTGSATWAKVRDLGPMTEIAPDAGIFQADLPIKLTDGPAGADCATDGNFKAINGSSGFFTDPLVRFDKAPANGNYCVRQGDVLTVTYFDQNDASGNTQTVTDSSTFDLRNGVLQSDKSVYIIGSDMILTLVEPDLNLDSQTAETAPLDLIEWDSHAFKGTMGPLGGSSAAFDAKPSTFVETGKDTGIFQSVIKIPKKLGSTLLERGEQIHLEYTDWGPAGSKTVGSNNQDIELTIYTSNFGATVELDQKVYTWTDRVYMTVVAPDHNFDPNLIDIIGDTNENKVSVSTRGHSIKYKLVETGVDTGIFTGYAILTGDANIKGTGGVDGDNTEPRGITSQCSPQCGPTDGFLQAEDSDGVSVSFEFTRDQTVTGSALIRWNIGEVKWLEASYPANGQGVLQIVDPDMNLDPKAVDKFDTNVWSDSDSGGIKLTMTETGEATGIFQGTVYFTTNFQSSGNRLHVAEGDTVTGEYKDRTLPAPYTPADQLRLTSTTFIGTVVPPLERAPATNPRIVDSFGNAITGSVKVGQQIQITADLTNGQDRDQPFAYLVQVQDGNGVTVSLSWITGTLTAGQSLNPAQSWTPTASGTYTAQIFVWQSIDNPNALSPPLSTTINVA